VGLASKRPGNPRRPGGDGLRHTNCPIGDRDRAMHGDFHPRDFADSWHLQHYCTRGRDSVCDRRGEARDCVRGLVLPGPPHCRAGLTSVGGGGRRKPGWSSLPCGAPACNARDLGVWKPCRLQPLFAASMGFERHCDISWGDQFSSGWDAHGRQLRESATAAFLATKLRSATSGDIGGSSPSPRC
jgi:hypothetical protein